MHFCFGAIDCAYNRCVCKISSDRKDKRALRIKYMLAHLLRTWISWILNKKFVKPQIIFRNRKQIIIFTEILNISRSVLRQNPFSHHIEPAVEFKTELPV